MDVLIRILAFCRFAHFAGALLRFLRSSKHGFRCSLNRSIKRRHICDYRSRPDYYNRTRRNYRLSHVQALYQVIPKAWPLLAAMLWVFPAHAATYNTAQINGKYYPLTGVLNNPAVGAAVELGTLAITKANPWVAGIGTGLVVYKMLEELFPGTFVAFRPGLVSESVPTWTNNVPPATSTTVQLNALKGYSRNGSGFWGTTNEVCVAANSGFHSQWISGVRWGCYNSSNQYQGTSFDISPSCKIPYDYPVNPGAAVSYTVTGNAAFTCNTFTGCPYGYSVSGSSCNLTNQNKVVYPSDGVSTYVVGPDGKFQPDPRDPDTPAASVSGISGSSSVTQKTTDGKQSSTTQANPDGSITHSTSNQYYDDLEGVLKDFKQSVTINNAGNVTNYSTSNNTVNVTNGETTPVNSDFPNDYNRESTQLELKDAVKNDIQAANDAKTALGSGPNQPTYEVSELNLPNQESFQVAPTEGMEALLPVNSGSCVTYPLNLPYFTGLVLDPCDVIYQVRPLVDWAVIAFGLLAGLFIWFGKSAEPA